MASKNQSRRLVRDRIALDVARFLASGGAVQVIEPGRCGSRADDNSFLFGFERRADLPSIDVVENLGTRVPIPERVAPDLLEIETEAVDADTLVDLVPDLPG